MCRAAPPAPPPRAARCRRARGAGALATALAVTLAAATAAAVDDGAGDAFPSAQRPAAETVYRQALHDCASQFQSSRCVEVAQAQRREALAEQRRQRVLLGDEQRQRRAAERLAVIERKAREADARVLMAWPHGPAAASAPTPAAVWAASPEAASRPRRTAASPDRAPASTPALQPAAAPRSDAQRRESGLHAREQAALEHRQALQQRNEARDARRPPSAGLPVPGARAAGPGRTGSRQATPTGKPQPVTDIN